MCSIVYLSDTAVECGLQELLRVIYTGIALYVSISHRYCDVSLIECLSVNPVLPANSEESSDWYNSSVYYNFVRETLKSTVIWQF